MKKHITIVIAAYNEEKTIGNVLDKVSKYADSVIVVDDGSYDKTASKVKGKKVTLLSHVINLGQGAALQTGFEYAKKNDADVVVTYDADGQQKPGEIKAMVAPILNGEADVVLGSRFLGKTVDIPLVRLLVLKLGLLFTRLYTGLRLTDTHNGFRAFSKMAIGKIDIKHNRWAHPSDILYQIAKNRFRVLEMPVTVYYSDHTIQKGQANKEAFTIPIKLILRALLEA